MLNKLIKHIVRIRVEEVVISDSVSDEALGNIQYFILSREDLLGLGVDTLTTFLNDCRSLIKDKWEGRPHIFYCWFDDMARQIRFSSISLEHKKPPFGIKLKKLDTIQEIVEIAFLYTDDGYFNPNINIQPIYINIEEQYRLTV